MKDRISLEKCRAVMSVILFTVFRESSEISKIQMDPTRDSTNPYVGLAFKLEVRYYSLSLLMQFCLTGRSQRVTFCCFL